MPFSKETSRSRCKLRLLQWTGGWLIFASPLMASMATAYQDATHFYLENDVLKIAVLRSTGNLDGMIHKQSGVNLHGFAADARVSLSKFRILFRE